MIVRGYHGTTLAAAEAILAGGFEPSHEDHHWLGAGVYFTEQSLSWGWNWARLAVKRDVSQGIASKPAVLAATIALEGCLDLADYAALKRLKEQGEELVRLGRMRAQRSLRLRTAAGKSIEIGDVPDKLLASLKDRHNFADHQVINSLCGRLLRETGRFPPSIRAPFIFGRQTHTNSYFFNEQHIQIAVIDLDVATDFELLR